MTPLECKRCGFQDDPVWSVSCFCGRISSVHTAVSELRSAVARRLGKDIYSDEVSVEVQRCIDALDPNRTDADTGVTS